MWINKQMFDDVLSSHKATNERAAAVWNTCHLLQGQIDVLRQQKAKDDVTIDWFRHRVNALEKERAILLNKTAGIMLPVPEIVPTRPGTISELPDFDHLPSFEDVGDDKAAKLGIQNDDEGHVQYGKPFSVPVPDPIAVDTAQSE